MSRPLRPRWALAVIVIAVAFGAGYGIRKAVEGGGDKAKTTPAARLGIPLDRARAVSLGISRSALLARFAGKPYETAPARSKDVACVVYVVSDRPATAWQFCFRRGRLVESARVAR